LFSFAFDKRLKVVGPIFGGVAITSITDIILIKGLKGVAFIPQSFVELIEQNTVTVILGALVFFTVLSYSIIYFTRFNILKVIILIGTFALALAFAGNDLVNFIGVPIAAFQSFELWQT